METMRREEGEWKERKIGEDRKRVKKKGRERDQNIERYKERERSFIHSLLTERFPPHTHLSGNIRESDIRILFLHLK